MCRVIRHTNLNIMVQLIWWIIIKVFDRNPVVLICFQVKLCGKRISFEKISQRYYTHKIRSNNCIQKKKKNHRIQNNNKITLFFSREKDPSQVLWGDRKILVGTSRFGVHGNQLYWKGSKTMNSVVLALTRALKEFAVFFFFYLIKVKFKFL